VKRVVSQIVPLVASSVAILAGCGGSSKTGPTPIAIAVTPTVATVNTGATLQFSAAVTGSSITAVFWAVNGTTGGDASGGTISVSGLYTAPASLPTPAVVAVTATAHADPSKSATATVTLAATVVVAVQPASATVAAGAAQQFVATVTNSPNTTVTWQVNGIVGGDAAVGTVSPTGQYVAPDAAAAVTVQAVAQADPAKSAASPVAVLAPHRIAVRTGADGLAELYDRATSGSFTARGNNYIRLATQTDYEGRTSVYHSTFNVALYDAPRAEAALATMELNGYNAVTVFIDGCCVGSIGDPAGGLSNGYMANVVDFLQRAKQHHVFVIITQFWLPDRGGWDPVCDHQQFDEINLLNLCAGGVAASSRFQHDFVQGLISRGAPLDIILAYELRDEYFYNTSLAPFTMNSGQVTAANGVSYDLGDPAAVQRMMDDGLVYFVDQLRSAIREVDPTALVTIAFFWPQSPNPARVGDPRVISVYPAITRSSVDFVNIHGYTVVGDLTIDQLMQNYGLVGYQAEKPVIMGEFGAFRPNYLLVADAAAALKAWQVGGCAYHMKGWLLWTWDTDEAPDGWNALEGDGSINRALAPVSRPDPCAP
jgi:hypothetical protein